MAHFGVIVTLTAQHKEAAMAAVLTIRDETTGGEAIQETTLEFPSETITVHDLIRERVYQEVQDYNRKREETFRGLIQPTDAEASLNGFKMKTRREIDWKKQFAKAVEAFESGGVIVLVGEKQAESLEETITIERGTEVTFLRLMPLVGG